MHTATADPLVGRTLEGRYRILDRIARGGMSTVYAALDQRLDRLVAVKVMASSLSADPAFSDRFTREARAAARLTHLNTVAVYDQGSDYSEAGEHAFLVMELVPGRTLRDLIRERGRLDVAQAVSIMESVLSALSAAHRAGIVHRDVKPENILLSDDGVVKVADFGLARAIESDPSATRTGLMMGTVAYCAPEQISKGSADQRSDVYSAGVVFFELLTGQPPYRGESAMNVAYQHVHSRVPAPSSRVTGIPTEIDELVINATDRDPAGRPPDAGVFLAELADVRADLALPVVAVPPRPRSADQRTASTGGSDRASGATTDVLGRRVRPAHDTSVVPSRFDAGGARGAGGPPPPVVTRPPVRTPPPQQRRPLSARARRRRRTLVGLLIVAIVGAAAVYTGWWFAAGRYGSIPNVTGDTPSAAVSLLRHDGYEVASATTTAFSETVPNGDVVATTPAIGSRLAHGRTISLVLSKGKERFSLPSVLNDTVAAARVALSAIPVNVEPGVLTEPSLTVAKDHVIGTNPAAGASVRRSQDVTILVSSGPPIVGIPSVAPNTPVADEVQVLDQLGFKTAQVTAYSTSVASGDVISLSPTGSAPKLSLITITVSKGPPTVVIPADLSDLPTVSHARDELQKLGLVVKVETAFGGGERIVVGVDPPVGTSVPVGSTVTLTTV